MPPIKPENMRGRTYFVVEATPHRIILEPENGGMPTNELVVITPNFKEPSDMAFLKYKGT